MTTIRLLVVGAVVSGMVFSSCKKDETATPAAPGGPSIINGRIVSPLQTPVANFPVYIPGKTPVSTDASGHFSIPGVTPPYTLIFMDASNNVFIFKGLTRTNPTLSFVANVDTGRSTNFFGTFHGGQYPQPADFLTYSFYVPQNSLPAVLWQATMTDSAFAAHTSWTGPQTTTGTLYFIQLQNSSLGLPLQFSGYASISGTSVSNGVPDTVENVNLTNPRDTVASGTITLPAGYTQSLLTAGIWLSQDFPSYFQRSDTSHSSSFSCGISPDVGTFALRVLAGNSSSQVTYTKTLHPGAVNAVTVPTGVQLALPPDATTHVDTSSIFSWTTISNGVYVARFRSLGISGPTYFVFTNEPSTSIPNLSPLGYGLPSSGNYLWSVIGYSPAGGVDALTATASNIATAGGFPKGTDGFVTTSAERSFVTRP